MEDGRKPKFSPFQKVTTALDCEGIALLVEGEVQVYRPVARKVRSTDFPTSNRAWCNAMSIGKKIKTVQIDGMEVRIFLQPATSFS